MNNLSMTQALSLWTELEAAYHGKNGFGGDVAEIYIYRAMPYEPSVAACDSRDELPPFAREAYNRANASLHNLFAHFSKENNARIEIEEEGWREHETLRNMRFTHRIHVRVRPKSVSAPPRAVDDKHWGARPQQEDEWMKKGAHEWQKAVVSRIREQAAYFRREGNGLARVETDEMNAALLDSVANAIENKQLWTKDLRFR